MAGNAASFTDWVNSLAARGRRRDMVELAVAYALILLVVWTPRPWQQLFWWVAAAAIAAITALSFESWQAMGLRRANFFRSLWIVGVALLAAAVAVTLAGWLHTLRLTGGPMLLLRKYWAYAFWAFVQQFLLQGFFLPRLLRLLPSAKLAVAVAAILFAAAHLPSPILAPITLLWGWVACLLFLRYRNLYILALAHAILGVTLAIAVPGPVDHNMRVGLGYLTYGHTYKTIPSAQP
ncbi:MAG: type II CAAX prenyl endopeptidase Rce1 family protein [Terracidiphilus sp.]